jgi:4-amino-4-deoxy-L-arabinose transferase-like glycosyltransferase
LIHLDGLLSSLILLSMLSLLAYHQGRKQVDLVVSGVSAGSSWLTKSPGILLVPIVGLVTVLSWRKTEENDWLPWVVNGLRRDLLPVAAWGGIAVLVFFVLWPAMWTAPLETLSRVRDGALAQAERGHLSPVFFNGRVYQDGQLGLAFYAVSYAWRSTPMVLAGLALGIAGWILGWDQSPPKARSSLLSLILSALLFSIGLSLSGKKVDRYLLPVYAPLMLLSAQGWVTGAAQLARRAEHLPRRRLTVGLLALVVALQGTAMGRSFPYYLSYFNPALGGPKKARDVLTVGWGEGLDEAARYLNRKPGAAELEVVSWYEPCLAYFFEGETLNVTNSADISEEHLAFLLEADYLVAYVHQ